MEVFDKMGRGCGGGCGTCKGVKLGTARGGAEPSEGFRHLILIDPEVVYDCVFSGDVPGG